MTARKPPFFWVVVAVGVVLLAYYPFVVHVLLAHGGTQRDRGWTSAPDGDGRPVVRTVDAAGPAAGKLVPGDRILAVSGDARVIPALDGHFLDLRPGDAYTLRVTRGGADIDVALVLGERSALPIWVALQYVLLSLALFLAGLLIGLLRPAERNARLWATACLMGAAFGLYISLPFPNFRLGPWEAAIAGLIDIPAAVCPSQPAPGAQPSRPVGRREAPPMGRRKSNRLSFPQPKSRRCQIMRKWGP